MIVSARRLVPATLIALLAPLLLAAPSEAADTGSISGVVTARPNDGTAVPYAGAGVVLDRYEDDSDIFTDPGFASGSSGADGTFTIPDLPDGRYEIRTYPSDYTHGQAELGDYGYEYYDDRSGPYDTQTVEVTDGAAVTLEHTIELRPIGHVTGRVLDEAGRPVQGSVLVAPELAGGSSVDTDENGYYDTLDGEWSDNLIPGDYEASFSPEASGNDAPIYYYETKPVAVTAGGTHTVDFTLVERPTVTFTVRDSSGKPAALAPVMFWMRDGDGAWKEPQYGPITTDEDGRFRITDQADEFRLRFSPEPGGTDVQEFWDGAYAFGDAQVVSFAGDVPLHRAYDVQLGPAPIKAGTPIVSGRPQAGRTLTARAGSWGPAGVAVRYQWLAGGHVIPGATRTKYVVTNQVAGKRLSVRVTGSLAGAAPVVRASAATAPATGVLRTSRPHVVGKARLAKKLSVSVPAWGPAPVRLTLQWLRDGRPVKGRTARTYRPVKADLGHRLSVRVTGRKSSYAVATLTSPASAKVRR